MKKAGIIISVTVFSMIFGLLFQDFRSELSAQSVSETEISGLQQRIQTFFESIAEPSGTTTAFNAMFSETQAQDDPAIQDMIQKTNELTKGTRWRFEFLDDRTIGQDIILVRYLYKSESYPVVWYFTFYRSQTVRSSVDTATSAGTWNCIGIKFDTNLDVFFNESKTK